MPSLPHRPVLAPRDGISSFVSVQSSDSYYSDHEIAILHRVVTAAQENLELLPEGERLATNALFQAYDAVLPLFGIDPEEENHISRLVFRVGGERGEGSLQEKLDAVLSRMGIGLEFGSEGSRALSNNGDDENEDEDGAGAGYEDAAPPQSALTDTDRDSDTSGDESSKDVELAPREPYAPLPPSQAQASHHLYDAESPPRLTRVGLVSNHLDLKPVNHKKPPSQSYTPSTAGNTEQSRQSRQSVSGTSVQRGASDTTVQPIEASNIYPANETEAAALPIRTKPVRTVNWVLPPDITSISTGTSVGATAPESVRNGTLGSEIAEDHVVHDVETRNSRGYELGTQKPSVHALVVHESTAQEITTHQAAKQMQPVEEPSDGGIEGDKAEPVIDDEINADPDDEARYALLEWKSTKVKGYLLLLRGLSHWKQHALDKLERMAVARRHILRMRHFDPWELVTAETRIRGRRVFTSRLMASWLRRAGEDLDTEYASLAHAQRNTAQNALRHWSTSCPTPMEPRYPPRVVSIYLQQWHSACSVSQRLESHMENLYEEYGRFRILKTWSHQAASHLRDVAAFRKYHVVQGALHQWHLDSRIEVFKSKLEIKLVRSCLSRWQNGCRAPPTLGQTNAFSRGIVVDSASGRALPGPRRGVYITGSAITILGDADTIIQTIYDDDPSHLQAAAFDESSGKITTCTESVIRVYKPFGQSENALKWGLQSSWPVPDRQHATKGISLSWGGNEELLVAHSALYLYSTADEPEQLWNKQLPNSVKLAEISYDSAYIACVGAHDCLVKVWRRLTYGAEDVRFDLAYLRHPDLVASLRWRKPLHTDQTVENVLFTTCADNLVRVWTGTDTHAFRHMNLWGSVDLASSFRDLGLGSTRPTAPLVTFVIDGREVSAATELAVQRCSVKDKPRDAALERLISLANNSAELCVASDAIGNMMIFAFEDVGSKTRKSQDAIRVTSFKSHTLDFRSDHQGADAHANGQEKTSISEFCRFKLKDAEGIAYMLPVDPAGSTPATSGFLDVFARDIAVSYTHAGRVDFWTARVGNTGKSVGWLSTSSAETGLVEPALVSGSTLKKAAIVDSARSQLFIWDIGGARLEFTQDYGRHNTIQDLDWTSTPDSQSILAVGFQSKVVLLSQMRFDYLNKGPAWAAVREISIREFTPHPIGDSTWLGDGHLVIGSGNQMFVHGREYDLSGSLINSLQLPHRKNGVWDLFDAVQRFNGPLPVFHPQFLSQCILAGKSTIVRTILMSLHKTLKFLIAGETVDDYLGLEPAVFYSSGASPTQASESQVGSHFSLQVSADETDSEEPFSEETALAINGRLTKVGLQQLSGHEQIQLADIVECVGIVEKQRRSLDENGARFMLFFRQHGLRKGRTSEIQMSWREINWAYHSNSQDILTDFVSKQCHGALRWEDARESGMFMWLTDRNALLAQFELVARNEYTKSEMKNPVDCSIYYLALKKKTVLQGLWRMAHWNREQGATQKLLSNNFEDPKWRTTALKNAYALLSKRRFEYAAAFFLLADHLQDAVNVCLNQLKDLQLAVAIARVYEGDRGPVLKKLLEEEVLAVAAKEGNRWLASWAFWMLNRKDMAVRALISPVYTLVETPCSPNMQSKLFLTDDPALVVLYSQLRQKTLQTLRGASKVTPRVEWEFVLHSAKLYDRMGCDLLGLDLVRNWEFLKPAPPITNGLGGEVNPLKLLRRRSSLVVADLPVSRLHSEIRPSGQGKQSTPTVFHEPDSSSLLDSFGF
ncbi:hypothetical protein CaCOL14_000694 [Colletotrichum acutatum]